MSRTKKAARRAQLKNKDKRERNPASATDATPNGSIATLNATSKKRKRGEEDQVDVIASPDVEDDNGAAASEPAKKKKKKNKKEKNDMNEKKGKKSKKGKKESTTDAPAEEDVDEEEIAQKQLIPLIPANALYHGYTGLQETKYRSASADASAAQDGDDEKKKKKAEKKATKLAKKLAKQAQAAVKPEADTQTEPKAKVKAKVKSKSKSKSKPNASATDGGEPMAVDPPAGNNNEAAGGAENDDGGGAPSGNTRFIAFIGNLPYSATKESVTAHFSSLRPSDVRVLTERLNPKRCRGMAFVEFDTFDRMKTCLAKFHHTDFDDGISPARKVNVELTAGGGGKNTTRQSKIMEKNRKLNEERVRRAQREEAAKLERQKEAAAKAQKTEEQEQSDIHPSRRSRVPVRGKKW